MKDPVLVDREECLDFLSDLELELLFSLCHRDHMATRRAVEAAKNKVKRKIKEMKGGDNAREEQQEEA